MFTFDAQRNKKKLTPICRLFMSLNTIKFNTADIAVLFKNSLVEVNPEKQVLPPVAINAEPIASGWKFLGENKKKTLIVVNYGDAVHIPDKQLSFLTKLLGACNLSLADVAILNFHNYNAADFDQILNHFKPKVVLLFDTEPGEFGMPMLFPQFQVQGYKDAVFVSSPSLEIIEPDKTLKGKLWVCLKKIFNL
jgi:hypothetical protein